MIILTYDYNLRLTASLNLLALVCFLELSFQSVVSIIVQGTVDSLALPCCLNWKFPPERFSYAVISVRLPILPQNGNV